MIASNRYNLQMAIQPGRGIYPTAPDFFFECPGTGLVPRPTISRLEICDGRLWSPSLKKVTYIETGGQVDLIAQPEGLGALLYGMLGAIDSTPGAPDEHVITPATDLSDFPYFIVWQFMDDEWRVFKDCQIVGGEFTVSTDSTWALIRPTIIGMAPMEYGSDLGEDEATEETEHFHWLDAGGYHFIGGDYTNAYMPDLPASLDDVKTVLAAFKTAYNAHCAVATGLHHQAADAVNVLAYGTPIADEAAAIAACTEIRTDSIAHNADDATHYFADVLNDIVHANPTTTATCITFLQELLGSVNSPGCYNRHLGAKAGSRSLTVSIDMAAQPIQGEAVVPYIIKRKRGSINVAVDLLLGDFELVNLALFGDPNPAAGTEMTTDIQHLSLYNKFIAQADEEWSVAFDVPQFDIDPEPLYGVTGNPAGDEIIRSIGGEASGDEGEEITITLKNTTAGY
ncbi:MAG: hypothetical protein JW990_07745 [Thermoleophilia bacterium]|nr:hypothetical protein [Thermoleophilia bacterium]